MKATGIALALFCAAAAVFAQELPKTTMLCTREMKATKEFKLLKAVYGTKEKNIDVTAKVQAMLDKKAKEIPATNALFTDPHKGKGKTLEVVYSVNGKIKARSVREAGKLKTADLK